MRADIDTLIQKSDMTQILRDDLVIKEELARRQNTIDALTRENAQLKNALRAANEEIRKNVDVVKNMKKKLREEEVQRRKLHDAIQCLKGAVGDIEKQGSHHARRYRLTNQEKRHD